MLTNALFVKRQAVFVGLAEKFLIKINMQGELIETQSKNAFSVDQLQQAIEDFNPVENKDDG
jgi:uncharacterized protein with GYD domain